MERNVKAWLDRLSKAVLAAICVLSLAFSILVQWEKLPSAWMGYVLVTVLLLLVIWLLATLASDRLKEAVRRRLQEHKAAKALARQLPTLEAFVSDLKRTLGRTGYQYSLPAVVDDLSSDSGRFEALPPVQASLAVLEQWASFIPEKLDFSRSRPTPKAIARLLLELQFILRETERLSGACEKHIPAGDDVDDGLHCEPQPNTELRNRWRQFCADYNKLMDDYERITRVCSQSIPELSSTRFMRL